MFHAKVRVLRNRYRWIESAWSPINTHCQVQSCLSLAYLIGLYSLSKFYLFLKGFSSLGNCIGKSFILSLLFFDHLFEFFDLVDGLFMVLLFQNAGRIWSEAIFSHVNPILTTFLSSWGCHLISENCWVISWCVVISCGLHRDLGGLA